VKIITVRLREAPRRLRTRRLRSYVSILAIYSLVCNLFMNLPAGSISTISRPTGNPLLIGMVSSSISPRLAFCPCQSLCRRAPEREAVRSVFAAPACSCLASARDRRVYQPRCRCQWLKVGSASGYRCSCAGDTSCASAAACVAALEAAVACPSHRAF